jgi:hypothetical protein
MAFTPRAASTGRGIKLPGRAGLPIWTIAMGRKKRTPNLDKILVPGREGDTISSGEPRRTRPVMALKLADACSGGTNLANGENWPESPWAGFRAVARASERHDGCPGDWIGAVVNTAVVTRGRSSGWGVAPRTPRSFLGAR